MISKSTVVELLNKRSLIVLLLFNTSIYSQPDSLPVEDIYNMSLEDLLKIKVTVTSTNSLFVFNTPSTVTIIEHEMIEEYSFLPVTNAQNTFADIDIMQTIIDNSCNWIWNKIYS